MEKKSLGIYVHIPFCLSKCAYCDFYSCRPKNMSAVEDYVSALCRHIRMYSDLTEEYTADTVYIGGGTPTVLPEESLTDLIRCINDTFHPAQGCEFTVEANPSDVTEKTLAAIRTAGANRLSMGLQSALDSELKLLGRRHTAEDFEKTFMAARRSGFDNISLDLMFGIPDQTGESFARTLGYAVSVSPEHISVYDLKIEPSTLFGKRTESYRFPDEDAEADMYENAVASLSDAGYRQYEISNFAKPGFESRHNLKYWKLDEYLGFGPGAHSLFRGSRFSIVKNTGKYIEAVNGGSDEPVIAGREECTEESLMGEYIMLGLRLADGISTDDFKARFGRDFTEMYRDRILKYEKSGFMKVSGKNVSLTPRGMFVSNYILTDILDFDENGRFVFAG